MSKTSTSIPIIPDEKSRTVMTPTFVPSSGKRPQDVLGLLEEALAGLDHLKHMDANRHVSIAFTDLERVIAFFKIYVVK